MLYFTLRTINVAVPATPITIKATKIKLVSPVLTVPAVLPVVVLFVIMIATWYVINKALTGLGKD